MLVGGAGRGGGCGVLLPRCCRNWSAVNTTPPQQPVPWEGGSSLRPAPCEDPRRVPTGQRTGDNQQRFIWLPASNMNNLAGLKYRVESLS